MVIRSDDALIRECSLNSIYLGERVLFGKVTRSLIDDSSKIANVMGAELSWDKVNC